MKPGLLSPSRIRPVARIMDRNMFGIANADVLPRR
jgi:hypothetical protein